MRTITLLGVLLLGSSAALANPYGKQQQQQQKQRASNSQANYIHELTEGRDYRITHSNAINGDKYGIIFFESGGGKRVTIDQSGKIYW